MVGSALQPPGCVKNTCWGIFFCLTQMLCLLRFQCSQFSFLQVCCIFKFISDDLMAFIDQHPGQLPKLAWPVTGSVTVIQGGKSDYNLRKGDSCLKVYLSFFLEEAPLNLSHT